MLLMKKLGIILLVATLLLLAPTYLVKADNWVEVARFQGGNGGLVVSEEHFKCDYGEWRIKWEVSLSKKALLNLLRLNSHLIRHSP